MARRELFILLGLAILSGLTVHIWTTAALGIMMNLQFSMPASLATASWTHLRPHHPHAVIGQRQSEAERYCFERAATP